MRIRTLPIDGIRSHIESHPRRGGILVLAAALLVVVFAMTSFAIDIGFISLTKAQIQSTADASAMAASYELTKSIGAGATLTVDQAVAAARQAAADLALVHRCGDLDTTPLDMQRDVRFGHRQWDVDTQQWIETWDTPPYNMVEVTPRRLESFGTALPLFFGGVLGKDKADVLASATYGPLPGSGFRQKNPGENINILPFAVDLETWEYYLEVMMGTTSNGTGGFPRLYDNYKYTSESASVVSRGDGKFELNIYPHTNNALPSGNRGTVDFGSPNNSTNDLKRQIEHGLNSYDLSFFPNSEISVADGPLSINGDTGISAGMKDALAAIQGELRCIPVFSNVYGNGNNAQYEVVKFVGVRVMDSRLTGSPAHRGLWVQFEPYSDVTVIGSKTSFSYDSIMTPPRLIR